MEAMDVATPQQQHQEAAAAAPEATDATQAAAPPTLAQGGKIASFKKQFSLTVRNTTVSPDVVIEEPVVQRLPTPSAAEVEDMLEADMKAMEEAGLLAPGTYETVMSPGKQDSVKGALQQLDNLSLMTE